MIHVMYLKTTGQIMSASQNCPLEEIPNDEFASVSFDINTLPNKNTQIIDPESKEIVSMPDDFTPFNP